MPKHTHINKIVTILKQSGARLTTARLQVLEYLCAQSKPVSVKQLEKKFPAINIVTLYRILEYFVQFGAVNELTHNSNEKYFELADPYHEHHHHTVCRKCGKVRDLQCKLTLPKMPNFIPEMHIVTVYGYCQTCKP